MVEGLEKLKEHFQGYEDKFIIIGGTACEVRLESRGIDYRVTTDIDMILVIEIIEKDFLELFWDFIRDGEYRVGEYEPERKNLFRFSDPSTRDFPVTMELFTRKPDGIVLPEGFHLTPFPQDDGFSGMSAMLLDDDYYNFTIKHSDIIDGLRIAREASLISLKCKAFLNNRERKERGEQVRNDDIQKHKKDVLKLAATLPGDDPIACPDSIRRDIGNFIDIVSFENPDVSTMVKNARLGNIKLSDILERMTAYFRLA